MLSHSDSLKRLLDRLPQNHPRRQFLEKELRGVEAGKRGEKRVKQKFNEFYSDEEFQVIWNVRLKINNWKVQMDGLLLTERCAIIIESKNISGKIYFDQETEEFYRIDDNGIKTVMDNPVIQLEKHIHFLREWFKLKKIELPIEGLIVFSSKKCEFMCKPPGWYICKTYQMNKYLYKILQANPHKTASIKLIKIKKMIGTSQFPYKQIPLCEHYHINIKDLETGVCCTSCSLRTMQRIRKNWNCSNCAHRDASAHNFAINEYFSLIGTSLNSRQFRDFCHVESPYVASRLLAQLELVSSGSAKMRTYAIESEK